MYINVGCHIKNNNQLKLSSVTFPCMTRESIGYMEECPNGNAVEPRSLYGLFNRMTSNKTAFCNQGAE